MSFNKASEDVIQFVKTDSNLVYMNTTTNYRERESFTTSSSSSSTDDAYFEKPIRSDLSEDSMIMTPPTLSFQKEREESSTPVDPLNNKTLSHKHSHVSISDMNDIPLEDNHEEYNPLKMITTALVNGDRPEIPVSTPQPTPLPARKSVDNESTTSTTRSIFTSFWSPFRSSSSTTSTPASSRRPSKQHSAPLPASSRPSAQFAARHQRLSRATSVISPLPGFQEALLAQMEQLNLENHNDPKLKVMKSLKRQSIRHSLITQNKGQDGYDWDFWAGLMCDYDNINKISKELIQHVRHGIPPSIRGMVWQLISRAKNEELVEMYINLLKLQSPYDKMIQRDLARTFPGHTYFKESDGQGQEGLYNVVRAYSLYDRDVGYCQGLAFIVGPMLLNMPDEDAFCLLVKLMNKYGLRGHFTPEMDGLQLRLYQFDALVQEYLPHVARHLKQQGINSTMYASQWFMTLFAYKFPLNLVFRIYDVIFTEGISSIFKFAIALLKRNQTHILGLEFEHLLDFLKNGLFQEYKDDDRRFVSDACELDIPLKKLILFEKEHKVQIQKETAEANMIDELQKTNMELKRQLDTLKAKMDTLKQEHQDVHGQFRQSLDELNALKEEGVTLKTVVQSLEQAISTLPEKIETKSKDEFETLCTENATLISKNSTLEDELQKAEMTLIDFKMKYAQSENERESLHKRLYEVKKMMNF
ncbi:GTPase-activating protein [Rhizopus azygosporus]|uniref:GTPase-activating protein n=2 Tax=Rhizopus TaxID=4842 RepID=A0A367JD80_RHIAZ|nr:GTPase-activating protein [Rhizopus azygosporus]